MGTNQIICVCYFTATDRITVGTISIVGCATVEGVNSKSSQCNVEDAVPAGRAVGIALSSPPYCVERVDGGDDRGNR